MYSFDSLSQYENPKIKATVLIPEIASSDEIFAAFLNPGVSVLMVSDMSTTICWDFSVLHKDLIFRLLRLGVRWGNGDSVRVGIFSLLL